jgi:hypothetical protein
MPLSGSLLPRVRAHPSCHGLAHGASAAVWLAYGLAMVRFISFAVVVVVAVLVMRHIFGSRYARRGQIECAWKSFDAPGKWRHGLATVSRGSFQFQPRLGSMGTRIPKGDAVSVVVESIDPDPARRPGLSQVWHLNPRLHILTVRTPSGPIELAMLPKRVPELRARLEI